MIELDIVEGDRQLDIAVLFEMLDEWAFNNLVSYYLTESIEDNSACSWIGVPAEHTELIRLFKVAHRRQVGIACQRQYTSAPVIL